MLPEMAKMKNAWEVAGPLAFDEAQGGNTCSLKNSN